MCFWKDLASYSTLEIDGVRERNAAWTYRHPFPLTRSIKNHVAFWGNLQVQAVQGESTR